MVNNGDKYGITRWEDPADVNARLKALTDQPIWEVKDDYYENEILKYYDEKCRASKEVFEKAKDVIPGGVQHNLAFNKPFPVCFTKAEGAYLFDKDGNDYEVVVVGKKSASNLFDWIWEELKTEVMMRPLEDNDE